MKVQAYSIKSDETFFLVHVDDGYPLLVVVLLHKSVEGGFQGESLGQ